MYSWILALIMAFVAIAVILSMGARAGGAMKLDLKCPVLMEDNRIPVKYTCDGEDVSPPLSWSPGPQGTKSYALIVDDPDAPGGTFTHWVAYNIPAGQTHFFEYMGAEARLSDGTMQGKNHFGRLGYGGPCPPAGKPHHYRFQVYALDTMLDLQPGASKEDVLRAMSNHVLADGEITGIYGR